MPKTKKWLLKYFFASILIFISVSGNTVHKNDEEKIGRISRPGEIAILQTSLLPTGFPKGRIFKGRRIIGGGTASPHEYPFQAALQITKQGEINPFLCGGSLISKEWILTAAHCLTMVQSVLVILGAHDIGTQEPSQVILSGGEFISHEDYNLDTLQDDIALVRLLQNFTMGNFINTVRLSGGSNTYSGVSATCIGWGKSGSDQFPSELRYVTLQVIPNDLCKLYSTFKKYITDKHLCTSGKGFRGSCQGDSGGPLLVDGKQIGIVSFGTKQCDLGVPSVYTRVSEYTSWITQKTGIAIDNGGHLGQKDHFMKVCMGMALNIVALKCLLLK